MVLILVLTGPSAMWASDRSILSLSTICLTTESAGRKERGKVVALTNAFHRPSMVLWPHGGDAPPVLNVQAKAHEAPVSSGVPGTAQTGRPLLTDTIVSGVCARSLVSHLSIGRQPVCRDDSCVYSCTVLLGSSAWFRFGCLTLHFFLSKKQQLKKSKDQSLRDVLKHALRGVGTYVCKLNTTTKKQKKNIYIYIYICSNTYVKLRGRPISLPFQIFSTPWIGLS